MVRAERLRERPGAPRGYAVAELAERAGVPVRQVEAIEAAEATSMPSLVATARALERNPHPLLLTAGFLGDRYVAPALAGLFLVGDEFPDGWGGWAPERLASARKLVRDPTVEGPAVRRLAAEVFGVAGVEETRWGERSATAYGRGEYAREITLLIDFWGYFDYRCWAASTTAVTWERLATTAAHVCEADLPRPAGAIA